MGACQTPLLGNRKWRALARWGKPRKGGGMGGEGNPYGPMAALFHAQLSCLCYPNQCGRGFISAPSGAAWVIT